MLLWRWCAHPHAVAWMRRQVISPSRYHPDWLQSWKPQSKYQTWSTVGSDPRMLGFEKQRHHRRSRGWARGFRRNECLSRKESALVKDHSGYKAGGSLFPTARDILERSLQSYLSLGSFNTSSTHLRRHCLIWNGHSKTPSTHKPQQGASPIIMCKV